MDVQVVTTLEGHADDIIGIDYAAQGSNAPELATGGCVKKRKLKMLGGLDLLNKVGGK